MPNVMTREQYGWPLSVDEFAILEFTNDGYAKSVREKIGPISVLTGKDSYYWAVAVAIAASKHDLVDEEEIYRALVNTFHSFQSDLKSRYSCLAFSEQGLGMMAERDLFRELLETFLKQLGCQKISFDEVVSRTNMAFDALVEKQLIEDPIELAMGGMFIAALGLVPYGFTTKTRRG